MSARGRPGVDYTVGAKPTVYKGQQFRSRLEARWAAFFDLCGWRWEYEPRDLPGWAPDFLLIGFQRVWVEVKPITALNEIDTTRFTQALALAGLDDEVLVAGVGPFQTKSTCENVPYWAVGWLAELWGGGGPDRSWGPFKMALLIKDVNDTAATGWKANADFFHSEDSYHGRMTGCGNGAHWLSAADVPSLWGRACSTVQWHITHPTP